MSCKNAQLALNFIRRELSKNVKILRDHRQDGNVAVGGIDNLAFVARVV